MRVLCVRRDREAQPVKVSSRRSITTGRIAFSVILGAALGGVIALFYWMAK